MGEDEVFKTLNLYHSRYKTCGLLFTEDVFAADTAFDVLLYDLTSESRFRVAVHRLLNVVLKIGDSQLGEKLLLYGVGNCLISGVDIVGV